MMGDSDDDGNSWRSRDKYPKEREVSPYERNDKRSFNSNNFQSPGKSNEPPYKRFRRDNDDYGSNRRYHDDNFNKPMFNKPPMDDLPNYPTQPLMLQFKSYLQQQDDNIQMEDAMVKYNEYKENFVKKQLKAFFDAHSAQEWFQEKYAPNLIDKRTEAIRSTANKRKEVFEYLEKKGWFDEIKLHNDECDEVVKLVDAVVILLEGGDENDLSILNTRRYRSESPNEPLKDDVDASTDIKKDTDDTKVEETSIENGEKETENLGPKPRALHKTYSIFLRNLHPNVLRSEIEELVKPYDGFLRLALQDPTPDRKFFRRGWVTYDCTVNIKEICWNLNNVRLNDCDIGAIVNRELTQRTRQISYLAMHKPVMKQDVKLAAKLIAKFDKRHGIWQQTCNDNKNPLGSTNPLLSNITEHLVDEGSYEEEALLGGNLNTNLEYQSESGDPTNVAITTDNVLAKVLDKLILYLRIVHSFDYYSMTEYQNEDEMPHKCGIIHIRGNNIPEKSFSQKNVEDYIKEIDTKASAYLSSTDYISVEDAKKLGYKTAEEAGEAFLEENTQKLGDDKWLCPLSGKKFKGPDFVRKHLLNKHIEKYDEARAKAAYFNNYILDNKRPQLPEHPGNKSNLRMDMKEENHMDRREFRGRYDGDRPYRQDGGNDWRRGDRDRSPNNFRNNYDNRGGYRRNYGDRRGGRGGGQRNGGGSYYSRKIMNYNDLDAPMDE